MAKLNYAGLVCICLLFGYASIPGDKGFDAVNDIDSWVMWNDWSTRQVVDGNIR